MVWWAYAVTAVVSWLAAKNAIASAQRQNVTGSELNKHATDRPIKKIYGSVKNHQGEIIFKHTNDNDDDDIKNDLLHIIVVWGHAVQSIDKVYLDDIDIETNNPLFVKDGNRYAYTRNFPNGMEGYNDPHLAAAGWRASDVCAGKACSYIRLEYGNGKNQLSNEPKIRADLTGTLTSNPADHLLDYLTNEEYGKGESVDLIDQDALNAVRTVCDTQVETYVGSGEYRSLFTCNFALDTSETVRDNINQILQSCRGIMPIIDGKLTPIVEKDDAPVAIEIEEKDILELGKITNGNKNSRFNRFICQYQDSEENATQQEAFYPPKDSPTDIAWLAQDNNKRLETSISLDSCDNYYEALAFAKTMGLISREQLSVSITLDVWANIYDAGDIVNVSHSIGWVSKPFRIVRKRKLNGKVVLLIREHQPYIYDFTNSGTKPTFPDITSTITRPAAPTNLTITDVYTRVKQVELSWQGVTTRYYIEITDSSDNIVISQMSLVKTFDVRNLPHDDYTVHVYAVNSIGTYSNVTTESLTINKDIKDFTWQIYADDDTGTNASLTDSSKAYTGLAFGQIVETPSLVDLSIYYWILNSASRWLIGSGPPAAGLGSIGQSYVDDETANVYIKTDTGWVLVGNFGSGDGDIFLSGDTDPTPGVGVNGATYLNLVTKELFKKIGGTWVSQGIIKGDKGEPGQDAAAIIASVFYDFNNTLNGWVPVNATPTLNSTYLELLATDNLSGLELSGVDLDPKLNFAIRLRVKCLDPTHTTELQFYYSKPSQPTSESYSYKVDVTYPQEEWMTLIIDARELTNGGLNYINEAGNITGIKIHLGNTASGKTFLIDEISIGRFGSPVELTLEDIRIEQLDQNLQDAINAALALDFTPIDARITENEARTLLGIAQDAEALIGIQGSQVKINNAESNISFLTGQTEYATQQIDQINHSGNGILAQATEYTRAAVGYEDINGNWVDGPIAQFIRDLEVDTANGSARINQVMEVFETIGDKLFARGSILSDVNGYISGFVNTNNGSTSQFDILSDNFRVGVLIDGEYVPSIDNYGNKTIFRNGWVNAQFMQVGSGDTYDQNGNPVMSGARISFGNPTSGDDNSFAQMTFYIGGDVATISMLNLGYIGIERYIPLAPAFHAKASSFGGWSFLAETGSGDAQFSDGYSTFTGKHGYLIDKTQPIDIDGMLMSDTTIYSRQDINNALTNAILTTQARDRTCAGVVSKTIELAIHQYEVVGINLNEQYQIKDTKKLALINAVGEGLMWVCDQGGDIEQGDWICSSDEAGHGMRQIDENSNYEKYFTDYTVAKSREDVDWSQEPDSKKLIAVYYRGG